jgi:hypothetical protein
MVASGLDETGLQLLHEKRQFLNSRATLFALAAAFAVTASAALAAPAPFVFAESGRAKAAVVVAEDAGPGAEFAVQELVDYLNKMTGARFPVATSPLKGWNTIYVGRPLSGDDRYEAFHIQASEDGRTLDLAGNDERGNAYAVYDLLETLGCGFWSPDNETVPFETNLVLSAGYEKSDAPAFSFRNNDEPFGDFAMVLKLRANTNRHRRDIQTRLDGMGGDAYESISHSLGNCQWVKSSVFFDAHPDWYALVEITDTNAWNKILRESSRYCGTNGIPTNLKGNWVRLRYIPCTMAQGMRDQLVKEVGDFLAANYPVHKSVSISTPDSSDYCHCAACRKLVDSDESRTSAVLYIDLINYVAKSLLPKYPKAHFNLLSYGAAYTPPKDAKRFKMGPGTGVAFAHHWRNHGVPINCCERFMPRFLGWRDVCDRFLFWEYYTNFHIYVNPFPNTDIFGPAFKFYLDNKFDGGFCQMTNSRLTPFADLNWWVKNRLMWNPNADAMALVDQYIEGAYGPAAPHVRRYLDIVLHAKRRQRWAWIGDYVDDTGNYLQPGDVLEIMRAMQKALASISKDPNIGRRIDVRRLAFSINHLGAMRYPDLIEPAKAERFRLAPWQEYSDGWKSTALDYLNSDEYMGARQLYGENDGSGLKGFFRYLDMLKETAETPTAWPERKLLSRVVAPAEMTGSPVRFAVTNDASGAPFSSLTYGWGGGEPKFMSPNWCEAGFTVTNDLEGVWYLFSNVSVDTTATNDPAAAYTGIYSPWYVGNFRVPNKRAEICSMRIARTKGDEGWRLACLGKWGLRPGARVWVMPGVVNETRNLGVRNFTLLSPEVFEKDVTLPGGIGSRHVSAAIRACEGAVEQKRDEIDRYFYAELDCLSTNGPGAINAPIAQSKDLSAFATGEKYVFARVRVSASDVLVGDAARVRLVQPAKAKGEEPERVIVDIPVGGSYGADSWQIISLGRVALEPGMVLGVVANDPATAAVALRDFVLVSPEFLETSVKAQ